MTNDVDKRLASIESKLDKLTEAISTMAAQNERIKYLEARVGSIWEYWDRLVGPGGTISVITQHQASCPRSQVRWLWVVIIPMGLTQIGVALALFQLIAGGGP